MLTSKASRTQYTAIDTINQYVIESRIPHKDTFVVVNFLIVSYDSEMFSLYFEKNFIFVICFTKNSKSWFIIKKEENHNQNRNSKNN